MASLCSYPSLPSHTPSCPIQNPSLGIRSKEEGRASKKELQVSDCFQTVFVSLKLNYPESVLMWQFWVRVVKFRRLLWHPSKQEPFLNQLAHVILVHNWYRSTSMCFHTYSREYMCFACCHEFWTSLSLTWVVLGQNWYGFTGTCRHDFTVNTPNLFTESGEFVWIEPVDLVISLTEHVKSRVVVCWVNCPESVLMWQKFWYRSSTLESCCDAI